MATTKKATKTKSKETAAPSTKKSKLETFEYEGAVYTVNPTVDVFLDEMARNGIISGNQATKVRKAFENIRWTHFSNFEKKTLDDLMDVKGVGEDTALKIFHHKRVVAAKGKFLKTIQDQVEENKKRQYLLTQVEDLNFNLFDGNDLGFRSGTLIEFYGKPQMGKTQWMYDLTIRCLLPKSRGGWGRSVIFIDTEGSFSIMRLLNAARYYGLSEDDINDKFFLIEPTLVLSGRDLYAVVDTIDSFVYEHDVGLIVVDSVIQPFRAEFASVTGKDLSRMAPRQSLLGKTLAKLKSLAKSFEMIVAYTNHVMANIGAVGGMGPNIVPLGGDTVGHASDLRFYLKKTKGQFSMETRAMILKDCGWLPSFEVPFILSEVGILPAEEDVVKKVKKFLSSLEKKEASELENHLGEPVAHSRFILNINEYKLKHGILKKKKKKKKEEEEISAAAD